MEEYLEKVSLDRIKEIRLRIAERGTRVTPTKGGKKEGSSEIEDPQFREENWEFLMIHTSKKAVDDNLLLPQESVSLRAQASTSISSEEGAVPEVKKDIRKRKRLDF